MSYDFLIFKPRKPIRSMEDMEEGAFLQQDPVIVVNVLSEMNPSTNWSREPDGGWFGSLDSEDGWYEFRVPATPDLCWTIHTSRRTATRSLVPAICRALGLIAFDGQALVIVHPDGVSRPA